MATGCDAWILPTLSTDALEHASEWNALINVMDGGTPTDFENSVYCRVRNVGDQQAPNVQLQFEYARVGTGGGAWVWVGSSSSIRSGSSIRSSPSSERNTPAFRSVGTTSQSVLTGSRSVREGQRMLSTLAARTGASAGDNLAEIAQLAFDFARVTYRVRDLLPEQLIVALPQALRRFLDRIRTHAQFRGSVGISRFGLARHQKVLEALEQGAFACFLEFLAEALEDLVEQRQSPTPLEKPVRAVVVRRFQLVPFRRGVRIQRKRNLARASLDRAGVIALVSEVVIQAGQQKRAKATATVFHPFQCIMLQQLKKEALSEILRVLVSRAASSNVGIKRIPVSAAERFERGG